MPMAEVGFKMFSLNSLYIGHTRRKWYSDSMVFILHDLHNRWSRVKFMYLFFSIDKLCDEVLNLANAIRYVDSLIQDKYISLL